MRVLLFLIILLSFAGCKPTENKVNSSEKTDPLVFVPVPFMEINSGTNGSFNDQQKTIITNQTDFDKAWASAFDRVSEKPKPPRIDFDTKLVVLVTMGMKTSGGYTTQVSSIVANKYEIKITVQEISPGSNCATADVITFPYQIIELERAKKKVSFELSEKTFNCD